ncbi:hypothetical protein [Nocardiopsis halotolerans]|uniref:hypothetical protein n=1 Tax=Nocardiopsis halotolerans TaxID=124252 RepID=UPI0004775370|nr:hypothetical protein [Nocardiopsis halotolerans]
MTQFSAALLSRAFGPLIALFSSPCGRHSNAAGRRRRSTRVRRYAPLPAPVEAATPPARTHRNSEIPKLPASAPAPRMAPPSEPFPADDIAPVRPCFATHERQRAFANPALTPAARAPEPRRAEPDTEEVRRGLDRAKARARIMYQQWKDDPDGQRSGEPAPRFEVVRARPARHAERDELTAATRTWTDQQAQQRDHRQGALA